MIPLLTLAACRVETDPPSAPGAAPGGDVWFYTSMYPSVIEAFGPLLAEELPGVRVQWFQQGSEKVAQRIEAEWAAGKSPACLVSTSDPFWFSRAAADGRFAPVTDGSPPAGPHALSDPGGAWVTARLSLLVLTANGATPPAERPAKLSDLADPRFAGKVTVADPLSSGSAFTWLAFTLHAGGWEAVEALKGNGLVAAGGNSAVLNRVASGEKPVGVILLENLLSADGTPATPIFPQDGAIPVPGPLAITKDCPNPAAARAVYDLILSPRGQALVVGGDMYAARPELAPPDGAPALTALPVAGWPEGFLERTRQEQDAIKAKWAEIVSR